MSDSPRLSPKQTGWFETQPMFFNATRPSDWVKFRNVFVTDLAGVRQIFRIRITRVKASCGFGVPLMQFREQHDDLLTWAENKGPDGTAQFQQKHKRRSLDDLPTP